MEVIEPVKKVTIIQENKFDVQKPTWIMIEKKHEDKKMTSPKKVV